MQDMFVYVMEYLSDEHFTHLNTADDISGWTTADIKVDKWIYQDIKSIIMVNSFLLLR